MTDKRCIAWMQEKDYLRRWILPTHGCNDEFARFKGRPIGDTPEVMPWDSHLNAGVDACVRRHITKTKGCPAASVNREVECRGAKKGEKRTLKPRKNDAVLHADAQSWVDEVREKRRRTL